MTVVWMIGRWDAPDAAVVAATIPPFVSAVKMRSFASPGEALRSGAALPDFVLVVQHRPAEFSRKDAERLLGALPLARFVVGLGPWCASHGRSERLWPESVAVPLADVPARLRLEAAGMERNQPPLPLTASREEMFLADRHSEPRP